MVYRYLIRRDYLITFNNFKVSSECVSCRRGAAGPGDETGVTGGKSNPWRTHDSVAWAPHHRCHRHQEERHPLRCHSADLQGEQHSVTQSVLCGAVQLLVSQLNTSLVFVSRSLVHHLSCNLFLFKALKHLHNYTDSFLFRYIFTPNWDRSKATEQLNKNCAARKTKIKYI